MPLSDTAIRNAKQREEQFELTDGDDLDVLVRPADLCVPPAREGGNGAIAARRLRRATASDLEHAP